MTSLENLQAQLTVQQGQLAQLIAQATMLPAQHALAMARNAQQQEQIAAMIQKTRDAIAAIPAGPAGV